MKHILFFVSILCLLALPDKGVSQGLDDVAGSGRALYIGARVGGSLGQFNQPGTIMTGNIGAYGRYQALPFLQGQFDLFYDVAGGGRRDLNRDLSLLREGAGSFPGQITNLEYINRHVYMHSVKAQLTARLSLPELNDSPVQPRVIVGASYAYIFRARENRDSYFIFENSTRVILSDTWENVGADYSTSNVTIIGGFALDFNLPNDQVFSVEFLYDKGLIDLNEIQFGQPENIEKFKTQRFGLNFSYSIF